MFDQYSETVTIEFQPKEIQFIENEVGIAIETEEDLITAIKYLIGVYY